MIQHTMLHSHDMRLFILSIFIAFMTSYTASDVKKHILNSEGAAKRIWLVCSASSMGIGIWAMHFVAMLAWKPIQSVTYSPELVFASLLIAIFGSFCALSLIHRSGVKIRKLICSGILLGSSISGMHYVGMLAMQGVKIEYHLMLFILSIVIGIILSVISLLICHYICKKEYSGVAKIVGALLISLSITAMHYIGMTATAVTISETLHVQPKHINYYELGVYVSLFAIAIIGIILASSYFVDRKMMEMESKYKPLLETPLVGIYIISNNLFLYVNEQFASIFGYTQQEILEQKSVSEVLCPENVSVLKQDYHPSRKPNVILEVNGIKKNGETLYLQILDYTETVLHDGKPAFMGSIADITAYKSRISQLINYDSLTGLPNRKKFEKQARKTLETCRKEKQSAAVLFINLDRFQEINDMLGHRNGDVLLLRAAQRLQRVLRKDDILCRYAGDEFIIFLKKINQDDAEKVAQRIVEKFSQSFPLEDEEFYLTASIGIGMYPFDGEELDTLIEHADTAVHVAKRKGKNKYEVYQAVETEAFLRKMKLKHGLRKALERQEFYMLYQPKFDVQTRQMVGVEALLRWESHEHGFVSPAEFIPILEEAGYIIGVGEWVIRKACEQLKEWHEKNLLLSMAVNVSVRQFHDPHFVNKVSHILQETGIEPQFLEIEVTESIMQDPRESIIILRQLKELGIKISIDDFGTGYSSLSVIHQLPIDCMKIDRSFIWGIHEDENVEAIVKTIIHMGQQLKLSIVAEGVETEQQFAFLRQYQNVFGQGFLFSPPLTVQALEEKFLFALQNELF